MYEKEISAAKIFCEKLNIKFCYELVPYYDKGCKLRDKLNKAIVDVERIEKLNNKYKFIRKWFEDIKKAAYLIGQDENLLLLNYILYSIIEDDADINILPMPDRENLETDFAPIFAIFYFIEDIIEAMEERGLPYSVISDTLHGFEAEIDEYYSVYGRSGVRIYIGWFLLFIKCRIIRIRRLNFEFTKLQNKIRVYKKESDIKILIDGEYIQRNGMICDSSVGDAEKQKYYAEIEKSDGKIIGYAVNFYGECVPEKVILEGYEEVLKVGDEVVSIHIPAEGEFTVEICLQSIKEMYEVIKKYYVEKNIRAFICTSWMMDKRLRDIMGRDTNITRFADLFYAYPLVSKGEDVKTYLFHVNENIELQDYPENSSMQRLVKKYLCEGNYIYEKGGIILV